MRCVKVTSLHMESKLVTPSDRTVPSGRLNPQQQCCNEILRANDFSNYLKASATLALEQSQSLLEVDETCICVRKPNRQDPCQKSRAPRPPVRSHSQQQCLRYARWRKRNVVRHQGYNSPEHLRVWKE